MTEHELCYTMPNGARLRIHYSRPDKWHTAELTLANGEVVRNHGTPPDAVAYLLRWATYEDKKVQPQTQERTRL